MHNQLDLEHKSQLHLISRRFPQKPPLREPKAEPPQPADRKERRAGGFRPGLSFLFALVAAALLTACSDPADTVHKAQAAAPQKAPAKLGTVAGKEFVFLPQSTIHFVGSKVTGSHNGGFKKFSGTLKAADGAIVGTPEITIDLNSIWTDSDRLTGHLKSPDFFDVAKFPQAKFTVTKINPTGPQQTVTGNLNLHGITKSISFPAKIQIVPDSLSIQADFAINRKDFNINYPGKPNDLIRDNVVIKLDLKAAPGTFSASNR